MKHIVDTMGTALDLNDVAAQSQYATEQLEELRAELRALRKDAERYRWLRDDPAGVHWWDSSVLELPGSMEFDAAVDAAMGAAVGAA